MAILRDHVTFFHIFFGLTPACQTLHCPAKREICFRHNCKAGAHALIRKLNSIGLLTEVAGIALFLAIALTAGRTQQWGMVLAALFVLCIADSVFFLCLHPSLLNIRIQEQRADGETALDLLSFLAKILMRIAPVVFGIGVIAGFIGMLSGWVRMLFASRESLEIWTALPGRAAVGIVAACALLPMAIHYKRKIRLDLPKVVQASRLLVGKTG